MIEPNIRGFARLADAVTGTQGKAVQGKFSNDLAIILSDVDLDPVARNENCDLVENVCHFGRGYAAVWLARHRSAQSHLRGFVQEKVNHDCSGTSVRRFPHSG